MESNISFISTSNVQPKIPSDHQTKLELTPCDVSFLIVTGIQQGLLFHKSEADLKPDIEHLKASFSHTLDIFYPLAGRLTVTENEDDMVSVSLDCNGAGAEFVHAIMAGVTVADILDPLYVPEHIFYSLFQMNRVPNHQGQSKPLLAVQVTELVDGIFIGMTMNHSVGDGTCFWNFFNTWAEISRTGISTVARKKPHFGREFLDGIVGLPIRIPSSQISVPEASLRPLLQQRVFHFRKETIAALKSEANSQMETTMITSLQALMAHVWISITRAREASDHHMTMFVVTVGMRKRLRVDLLTDQYLGNAVLSVPVISTVGELLQGRLGGAAMKLNKAIELNASEEELVKYFSGYANNPSIVKKSPGGNVLHPLIVGNSQWFDVYGNDFGWGSPVAARQGCGSKFPGRMTLFGGAEKGSIDFEFCLSSQLLQALEDDEEFMKSVA